LTHVTMVAVAALLGAAGSAFGEGLVEFQVSPALQEQWTNSIIALPGQSIDVRVRLTYTGSAAPLGFGSTQFQPTISNWDVSGPSLDVMAPLWNNGIGGARTNPPGQVPDAPGLYARIAPFGYSATTTSTFLKGHLNSHQGVSYLRVAQAHKTSWVGGAGNTTGGGGVYCFQPHLDYATANPEIPAFNTNITNIVVFKFGITLSADADPRILVVNAAEDGLPSNFNTILKWFATSGEPLGTIRGDATYVPATIQVVPAPGGLLALLGLSAAARRRRTR
jgi:hypothetical protein